MRIANVKQREVKSDYDERFTDRLRLDSQTGTLTIKQLRVSDSGVYMSTSISNNILSQRFNLVVYSEYTGHFFSVRLGMKIIKKGCIIYSTLQGHITYGWVSE